MAKQDTCRSDSKLLDGEKSGNRAHLWYFVFLVAALLVNLSRHVVNRQNTAYMVDYQLVYVGCNAFVNGANPYDRGTLETYSEALTGKGILCGGPFMYPPSILVLYQPLTLLPWVVSVRLFTLLNILFFGGIIFLIPRISIASFERIDWILLLFVFAGSKLVHLQLIAGQPFVSAYFFGLLSILPACRENKWISGLALSFAMLKPTIALPFLLFLLYSRNFTSVFFCCFLTAMFNLSPFASMPFDTLSTYKMSFEQSFASGSINDYAYMNPCFQSLTDIRTLFYVLTSSRLTSTVLKYLFLASLVGYLIVRRRAFFDDNPENILVAVTLVSLWGLYHQALDMTSISVLFCVIAPTRLLCRWWGILVLAPLTMPTTGIYLRLKEYMPDMAYRLSVLDFHFSLIGILIVWIVVMRKGWKVKS